MNKVMKKYVITLILVMCVCISGVLTFTVIPVEAATKASGSNKTTVNTIKKGKKITINGYVYKVTKVNKKNSTVSLVGMSAAKKKKTTKLKVPASVKIKVKKGKNKGTYSYKVSSIGAKAFKNNKKLKSVTIGKNVTSIGKSAFENCSALTTVKLAKGSKLKTIKDRAFYNCKKLKSFNFSAAKNLKSAPKSAFAKTKIKNKIIGKEGTGDATDYNYEVIPLASPLNGYFYIKTDNPDPDSFRFVDKNSKYKDDSSPAVIENTDNVFADVKYENESKRRVRGGYIADSYYTDGGEWILQKRNSKVQYNWQDDAYVDTKTKITVPALVDVADYLIKNYANGSTYFDKMDAVQSGFSSICLYNGAYVMGQQHKSTTSPYYGLSTSPHADQNFYIQDPYYRDDGKYMLVSQLYPFIYDSLGFPSVMAAVAERLSSEATIQWDGYYHYYVNVTYKGTTRKYGGAGSGGGQGIYENMIKGYYKFDNSSTDLYKSRSLTNYKNLICEYGKMTVPEDPNDEPELTWNQVCEAVGVEGRYVRLLLLDSIFFGASGTGYTYLYDGGWGYPRYFSNVWYDGRYFNEHEYFVKGTRFSDAPTADIVIKDPVINFPDNGRQYCFGSTPLENCDKYDSETKVWKGFVYFNYDEEKGVWISDEASNIYYKTDSGYKYCDTDEELWAAFTLTAERVRKLKVDRNTFVNPSSYLIYDMKSKPGTEAK